MADGEVFISHHHLDSTLALLVKELLEDTFLNLSVFVSGVDLAGGDIWINALRERLANAKVVISVITQHSASSPWVLFESGAGFIHSKCIPVCADEVGIRKLQPPLSLLHARAFTEDGLQRLVKDIARTLSIRAPKTLPTLSAIISRANEFVVDRKKGPIVTKGTTRGVLLYDKAYAKRVDTVVQALRKKIIAKVRAVSDRYDVPSASELEKMKLSDLSEMASAFSIPVPQIALAQLLLLQVSPLEANAPKWKVMNYDKKLRSMEKNLENLSLFGI